MSSDPGASTRSIASRVDVADVYKGDHLAGRLTRRGGTIEFTYLDTYRREGGPAVGFRLPVTDQPVVAGGGSVPPFFANLLPEGGRLQALVARVKTSADDMLSLLVAVGADCVGDVRVLPAGSEPPVRERQAVASWSDVSFEELLERSVSTRVSDHDPAAIPGVQEKVSDAMISFPVSAQIGPAILKLSPPRFPRIVENEHFFLAMARACGLETAAAHLVHDRDGRSGLLVERFDRLVGSDGNVVRLALEDGCQLCDVFPADKYRMRTLEIARACEEFAIPAVVATARLIELVAFSFLVGNEDLHAKNMSLLVEGDGVVRFWPGYDILTTLPYPISHQMALEFEGRENRLRRRDFLTFAARTGVGARAVERSLDRICDIAPAWLDRIGEVGFDDRTTTRCVEEMQRRRDRLGAVANTGAARL
ncbi:MAG: HipA domain-containing protein [Actinobacteria bacterium]|nr:HipA domain-containing protein [Actinomycetota bacterium]